MACKSWYENFYEKISKTLIRDIVEILQMAIF